MSDPRVLIVVFDALRPDMVSEELMPNLCRFARSGVRYTDSRAVFPSETRVNQTSMVTGCRPGRHGIVGNKFIEPVASPQALFNTGNEDQLREGDVRLGGELLAVRSMGERLAANAKRLATLSAGTPGGGRILHHRAESLGGFRLALHATDRAVPQGVFDRISERLGPVPRHRIPSIDWLTYAVDVWLQWVEVEETPDVGVLWLCEPDNSYHYCGIGAPENLEAIRHADAEFGRLLDGLDTDTMHIITMSDHGQVAVDGDAVDATAALEAAGFTVGAMPGPEADVALAFDSGGGIFVRDHDPDLTVRVARWLSEQTWCAAVSVSDDIAATHEGEFFSHSQFAIDGPRAPDVGLVLHADDADGPWGWPGQSLQDAKYPNGGGIHGGLHPLELNNWLAFAGPGIAPDRSCAVPAGIIDLLPTVFAMLGLAVPDDVDGRVLTEGLDASAPNPPVQAHLWQAGSSAKSLAARTVGSTRYLDGLIFPSES